MTHKPFLFFTQEDGAKTNAGGTWIRISTANRLLNERGESTEICEDDGTVTYGGLVLRPIEREVECDLDHKTAKYFCDKDVERYITRWGVEDKPYPKCPKCGKDLR